MPTAAELQALAIQHYQSGNLPEAVACLLCAIELQPDCMAAHCDLGVILQQQGRYEEAITCYRRALEINPLSVQIHLNVGTALDALGNIDEALWHYRRAVALSPASVDASFNLASALDKRGLYDEALALYRQIIQAASGHVRAYNNLASILQDQGEYQEAADWYTAAIAQNSQLPEIHLNLGSVLRELGRLDEAAACYRKTLALQPGYALAFNHFGNLHKDAGAIDAAIAQYQRAVSSDPAAMYSQSNLLYALQFSENYDAEAIHQAHRYFEQRFAHSHPKTIQPHANDRSPHRRLRIGYVSPDFCDHVLSLLTTPVLESHDHQQFEIFCYADVVRPNPLTDRIRTAADQWRSIVGLSDEEAAQLIRSDQIDILVDLTMHMRRHRLMIFAQKPAPVQVTWLAYPGTTGLSTIDYRLTDPYLDPPGLFDRFYTEKSIRLPDTFWCYDPLSSEPPVNSLPALANGYITFGCLNNFCKTNATTFSLWVQVLQSVPNSRLLMLTDQGSHRQHTLELFQQHGIASERISFVPRQSRNKYLETYHHIDIGLDTVPYNGHTTSLDAYWMGVPVVTLVGKTVVGRAGLSQLTNLGLTELIAHTPEQFVAIAANLASDIDRLSQLRQTLRQRLQASPLMDAPRFAENIEAAYRRMWQTWCSS